jgi:hypothetical protein
LTPPPVRRLPTAHTRHNAHASDWSDASLGTGRGGSAKPSSSHAPPPPAATAADRRRYPPPLPPSPHPLTRVRVAVSAGGLISLGGQG